MNLIPESSSKVILTVVEGPEKGKNFEFTEQDNFLVGRDAPGSHAHFRLSSDDHAVSRNHFLIEINPPDCYLRDAGSMNGTFIIRRLGKSIVFFMEGRAENDWEKHAANFAKLISCKSYKKVNERIKLEDGDLIIVGNTVLGVAVQQQVEAEGYEGKVESVEGLSQCIRCGKDLTQKLLLKEKDSFSSSDFICDHCKERRIGISQYTPTVSLTCWGCGKDITSTANADGKANELKDIALYWCERCASSKQHNVSLPRIDEYRLLQELGFGGFGVVYLAWHELTGRISALKIAKERMKKNSESVKRFAREIATMKESPHSHLVSLFDDGIYEDEYYYLVSEYMSEGSLMDIFYNRYQSKIPYKEACLFFVQALDGLTHFHKKYVHRDLKPENILVRKDDRNNLIAKVGDFGLSRSYILHGGTITRQGEWAGTLFFCSPEQILNFKSVTPSSDVYAMGISMYYLITGEFPYEFPTREKYLELISKGKKPKNPIEIILGNDKPTPIEEKKKDIPAGLAQAVSKAIEKEASRRFASADDFKKALERCM